MSDQIKRAARKGRASLTRQLLLASSILAFVGGVSLAGSAMAQCTGSAVTIAGPTSGAYTGPGYAVDKGTTSNNSPNNQTFTTCPVSTTITQGTAVLMAGYSYLGTVQNNGWVPLYNFSGALTTTSGAPQGGDLVGPINVSAGATLVFGGQQSIYSSPYEPVNNLINAAGNVIFQGNGGFAGGNQFGLTGTNTLDGNVTLEAGANVRVGEYYGTPGGAFGSYTASGYYASGAVNFGPTTNVALQGTTGSGKDTLLYLNLNAPAVIGGSLSATTQSEVWLHAGSLTVNGANTIGSPFVGTLQLDPGTTLIVGDSTHASAVFGDPGNTNGSTETLNIVRTSGTPATLMGYGTIYATVNNAGVVQPGGTAGTLGTLTVSTYVQSATGILNIEVSPGGASELKVLGSATLAGTLDLKIDAGKYGNAIYPIISAGSITGSFSNIETTGAAAAGLAITPTGYDVVTELTSSAQVFGHLVSADRIQIDGFTDELYDMLQTSGGAPHADYGHGVEAWIEPIGQATSIRSGGYGYDTMTEGVTGGLQHRWANNAVVGLAGSYTSGDLKTDSSQTRADTDTYDAAIYGRYDFPNAKLEGAVFYNSYTASVTRNLGASGSIGSSPNGRAYGASLQFSNDLGPLLTPYLRVTYSNISQPGVTESGTNLLALKINGLQEGYFVGETGFKIHPNLLTFDGHIRPELTLAVQHDFSQTPGENVTAQFANLGGSPFLFNWKGDQGTAGIVGLRMSGDVTSRIQVYGKVDARFSADSQTAELRLGGSYRF